MDEQLKQRVVGTAVIAALVVVFVPMLLDGDGLGEPEPPRRINPLTGAPARLDPGLPPSDPASRASERRPFKSTVVSASELTRAPPSTALAAKSSDREEEPAVEQMAPADAELIAAKEREQILAHARAAQQMQRDQREAVKRRAAQAKALRAKRAAAVEKARPPVARAPVKREPPARAAKPSGASFMIQLGSFGDAANAQRLKRELDKEGYRCVLQQLTVAGKPVTRVLVGPINGREEADRVRERLASKTRLRAIVVSSS